MSNEGSEENAGRTTTRITSGSTWAWNTYRPGSGGRNRGGTYYSWNKYEDPPATYDLREGFVQPERRREARHVSAMLLPQDVGLV
jgi:hypothetical protein